MSAARTARTGQSRIVATAFLCLITPTNGTALLAPDSGESGSNSPHSLENDNDNDVYFTLATSDSRTEKYKTVVE